MSRKREPTIEEILNQCVERIARGATVDDCLSAFPEWAEELAPLLETANVLQGGLRMAPTDTARSAGLERVRRAMGQISPRKPSRLPVLGGPLGAWAAAAVAVVIFAGGFGVVQASSDSLPNDVLYPVKRTVERVRLAWPLRSDEGKARLSEKFARRRGEEIARIATNNKPERVAALAELLAKDVDRAVGLSLKQADKAEARAAKRLRRATGEPPEAEMQRIRKLYQAMETRLGGTRARLERDYLLTRTRLEALLPRAPDDRKAQVQSAIQQLDRHYQDGLRRVDERLALLKEHGPPFARGAPGRDGRKAGPELRSRPAISL